MTDRDLTNLVLHVVELSEPEIFEAFHKGFEFSSLSISVKSSIFNSRMGLSAMDRVTKINTNNEVTFGDELTSNMSPFFKFCRNHW